MGSDLRRHRTTARPHHSSSTPQTPPRLPSLVDARSILYPLPRVTRPVAHQHRQRLLRRVSVPAFDVGSTCSAARPLDTEAGSRVAGAADVRGVANMDRGRQEFQGMGDRWSVRSPLKRGRQPQAREGETRMGRASAQANESCRPETCLGCSKGRIIPGCPLHDPQERRA